MTLKSVLIGAALALLPSFALAQAQFVTPKGGANEYATGTVDMCLNSSNQAIPVGPACANPVPVTIAPGSGSISHASVSSLGTSLVAKAAPGNLYGFHCTGIAGAAAGYCIAYNAIAAPSTGALTGSLVLDACYFGTSPAGCSLSRIPMGAAYSAGIVILVSTAATPFTYTTGTDTAFISADYQ